MKILVLQFVSTWFMIGIIWLVQIVHYPLFAHVGQDSFPAYEALHTRWITYVVAIPMLIELLASGFWIIERDRRISRWIPWVGLGLVLLIWFSTFAFSVQNHNQLMKGFQEEAWRNLVSTNWIRTLAWTARGGLLVIALFKVTRWGLSGNPLTSRGSSQNIPNKVGE